MKPANILTSMPVRKPQKNAQANIDADLHRKVSAELKKRGQTWVDLIGAACHQYLEATCPAKRKQAG